MKKYYLWEKSRIYTTFGEGETWMLARGYERNKTFDKNLFITGVYNNQSFSNLPIDMSQMQNPSSYVVKVTTRQNSAQQPLTSFYNPMHKFCKTDGRLVYAKDLKAGFQLAALQSESIVVYSEMFEQKNSKWFVLTTDGESPNMFVDLLMSFPTSSEELIKFEEEMLERKSESVEYSEKPVEILEVFTEDLQKPVETEVTKEVNRFTSVQTRYIDPMMYARNTDPDIRNVREFEKPISLDQIFRPTDISNSSSSELNTLRQLENL